MLFDDIVSGKRYKFIFKCIKSKNNFFVIQYLKNISTNDISSVKDENNQNIFMNIVKYGTNDMLKFFMNKYSNYNLDESDHMGVHVLFYLVKRTSLDIEYLRSFFIRCNRDINIWSEQYGSLLFHSIQCKNMQVFSLLISMGADVNGLDNEQKPLIYYCVQNGLIEVSNILINHLDFNVNNTNFSNESILEVAIVKCMTLHAKLILAKCPNILKYRNDVLRLMDYSIDSRSTSIAWKLYQHYCAYVIQKTFKKYIAKRRTNTQIFSELIN